LSYRVFYSAGPGDIIEAHKYWKRKEHCPTEVSITFSGQFADFCEEIGAEAYLVSYHPRKDLIHDGPFVLENRPKPMPGSSGLKFHLAETIYGLRLLATAVRFRAHAAVLDSGGTYYFLTSLFRLAGIQLVPVLYNSLWPSGFPPTRPVPRLILWLDSLFFRWMTRAVIGISPECTRQVDQLTRGHHAPLLQVRPQFIPEYFEQIPPPPPFDQRPFRIMYIGRINLSKGVFDILEMAQKVESKAPGQVRWEICGSGPDLERLKERHHEMALGPIVQIHGWTSLPELIQVYARSHAAIVPTRSSFTEGLAMTAAEAILAGRPLISNPVVPALEILRPACVEARTNDVDSYVEAVLRLTSDREYYESLRHACPVLAKQFYDREQGLAAVLRRVIGPPKHRVPLEMPSNGEKEKERAGHAHPEGVKSSDS
jgi:glycosyltransferase involved in cell wall biosynthesis